MTVIANTSTSSCRPYIVHVSYHSCNNLLSNILCTFTADAHLQRRLAAN